MKKMNNKGFAVSTILYGLVIMVFLIVALLMSLMSTNRKNTSSLVSQVESDLNRFSMTKTSFAYESYGQEYIVPESGWYKVELWGASGGGSSSVNGGRGSYTSGVIYLDKDNILYFYVGGQANGGTGGYNGGGTTSGNKYGGGGATDVRLSDGPGDPELGSRIMVAAGGGGAGGSPLQAGGDGGTLFGYDGQGIHKGFGATNDAGGKQEGYKSSCSTAYCGQGAGDFGSGGSANWNNELIGSGGAGYYGGSSGGGGSSNGSGGGGSSYISGYAGVVSVGQAGEDLTMSDSGKYFINGLMIPGVNDGDGKARIELVWTGDANNRPPVKNNSFSEVRYIKDCVSFSSEYPDYQWIEIQAISNGKNVTFGRRINEIDKTINIDFLTDGKLNNDKVSTKKEGVTDRCVTMNLGAVYNLQEIAVWHNPGSAIVKHDLSIGTTSPTQYVLKNSDETFVEEETFAGIRFNPWQTMMTMTDGNYYIFSSLSDKLVLTNDSAGNVYLERFQASDSQVWNIKKSTNGYQIINKKTGHALQVRDGINELGEIINASRPISNQNYDLWGINLEDNGYWQFKSNLGYYLSSEKSTVSHGDKLVLGADASKGVQFKLIDADY